MVKHISETPATQALRRNRIAYSEHPYDYEEHGGTAVSSSKLGVPEHVPAEEVRRILEKLADEIMVDLKAGAEVPA